MPLLGYRISQKSVLWPLIAVLVPAWVWIGWLIREPEADGRVRAGYREQLEHLVLTSELDGRNVVPIIKDLLQSGEEAGLLTDALGAEAALVWQQLGEADKAQTLFASITKPKEPLPLVYYEVIRKRLSGEALAKSETDALGKQFEAKPQDWWLCYLTGAAIPELPLLVKNQGVQGAWKLIPLGVLVVGGILAFFPALMLLFRYPWPRFIWAERIQSFWSLPQVLLPVGLRGMLTLAFRYVIGFLSLYLMGAFRWLPEEQRAQVHLALISVANIVLAFALVWMVKEIVGGRPSKLHELLGFDQWDFRDWRLWVVAAGVGIPLALFSTVVFDWLAGMRLPGHPILDELSRSMTGLATFNVILAVVQFVIVAVFVEEVIYRGFLLSAVRNWCGPAGAVILTSGLLVLLQANSTAGAAVVFLQSAVLALVKLKTQRLAVSMMMHALVQVVVLLQNGAG